MDPGKLVFAQLMEFLPRHDFDACVRRYGGDRRPRGFSCRDQFLCLAFAATDLPRKPPRHRDVSAILPAQALPCGLPRQHLAEHVGRRQPRPRLAHLRRFRSSVDRSSAKAVCRRAHGRGTGTDRLCAGQHHDRPLPEPVPVGAVPASQRGGEAAHARGPAGQHPHFRADYPREDPRRHGPRSSADRAGFVLRDGSRVCRFSTPSSVHDRVRRSS